MDIDDNSNGGSQLNSVHKLDFVSEECHTPGNVDADDDLSKSNVPMGDKGKELAESRCPKEWIPDVGMEFESEQDAYDFYNRYAHKMGFSIRRSHAHVRKGELRDRTFCCSCQGHRRKDKRDDDVKNPRPNTRFDCLARMKISLSLYNGKYRVFEFISDHTHEVVVPSRVQLLRSHRKSSAKAAESNMAEISGIAQGVTMELMAKQVGGHVNLGFIPVEYKHYLQSKRMVKMHVGDAGGLLEYLGKMQVEDPKFFYSIQVDVDDMITNIFWADGRMVMDYEHFGDVVCFNATYRKSDDCRPFGLFGGVNHHKQTVIFGAALLYDETADSFRWLFDTFLKAMSGKKPKTIFTDQDAAMATAIASQLPKTHHRLCVWHVYQNATKYLSGVFQEFKSFTKDFSCCIYDHDEEEDFIFAWNEMLERYSLKGNDWLKQLFAQREKWSLVYGRNTFSADISNTQRSESMNGQLKIYLNIKYDMLQFCHHFQRLVEDRRYEELKADFRASQSTPRLPAQLDILKHAANEYTPAIFQMFQDEVLHVLNCDMYNCSEIGTVTEYRMKIRGKHQEHTVKFDSSDGTLVCSCRKYEFVGILCTHALKVLDLRNIRMIPPRYILKRWTKDVKVRCVRDTRGLWHDPKTELGRRYKDLCHMYIQMAARAAETEEAYAIAAGYSDKILQEVEGSLKNRPNPERSIVGSHSIKTISEQPEGVTVESLDAESTSECAKSMRCDDGSNRVSLVDTETSTRTRGTKHKEKSVCGSTRSAGALERASKKKKALDRPPPTELVQDHPPPCGSFDRGANLLSGHHMDWCMIPNQTTDQSSNPTMYKQPSMTQVVDQPSNPSVCQQPNPSNSQHGSSSLGQIVVQLSNPSMSQQPNPSINNPSLVQHRFSNMTHLL